MISEITPLRAGATAPNFRLTDVVSQQPVSLYPITGRGAVIDFWSVECPWTRHYDDTLLEHTERWVAQGVALLMINSNANESADEMRDMADAYGIRNPILLDEGGAVCDAYGAITTPHIFVVDPQGIILYQGAIDDRSFRQQNPTVNYLDAAVAALIEGRMPEISESAAYGCAIVRNG